MLICFIGFILVHTSIIAKKYLFFINKIVKMRFVSRKDGEFVFNLL